MVQGRRRRPAAGQQVLPIDWPVDTLRGHERAGETEGTTGCFVVTTDEGPYFVKHPLTSDPPHRFLLLNEFVSSRIAGACGVPVPTYRWVTFKGRCYFGSRALTVFPNPVSTLARCANRSRLYNLGAFDVLMANNDRGTRHIVFDQVRNLITFAAIDHSQCPLPYGMSIARLAAWSDGQPPDDSLPFWLKQQLTDPGAFLGAATLVESVDLTQLYSIVESIPGPRFLRSDVVTVYDVLSRRQSSLREWVVGLNESIRFIGR